LSYTDGFNEVCRENHGTSNSWFLQMVFASGINFPLVFIFYFSFIFYHFSPEKH
jgi:hypothetical protein